jgi:hypothetical protein
MRASGLPPTPEGSAFVIVVTAIEIVVAFDRRYSKYLTFQFSKGEAL